jgi:2-hydroxy-3-keto-5-methylthiopentenyl-1-phosphate phosphatase
VGHWYDSVIASWPLFPLLPKGCQLLHSEATRPNNRRLHRCTTATAVFCDFDGTITGVDATDAMLETFALPAWRDWEQRWVNGEIASQECLARQIELIQADRETLIRFAETLPVDEGIMALDRCCTEEGVPLTIVSDGIDLLVEAVLRRHNLLHLPVYSNHLHWDPAGKPSLSFPFAVRECESGAGTCKCALTRPLDSGTIYIGDGRSDQCVSTKIQTLFAKGTLREWCEAQRIPYLPFATLKDVAERIFSKEATIP